MTVIKTNYVRESNRKSLLRLEIYDFFQIPDEGTVYRLMEIPVGKNITILNMDDLSLSTLPCGTMVDRVEINSVSIEMEFLNAL